MSKSVGEIKTDVLHRMRQFSKKGTQLYDNDYLLSMVPLINIHQFVVARDTKCIEKPYKFSHFMPDNLIGEYEWLEEEVHTDTDKSYIGESAKAYSLQIANYATVYIEESADQDTWVTLYTITKTLASVTVTDGMTPVVTTLDGTHDFITVKGKTNLSDDDYYVRIRFGGTYRYPYRYAALFEDLFYDDDEVPEYMPWVSYDLPTDLFGINSVSWTFAHQQKKDYNDYRIEKHDKVERKIYVNWYEKGEFTIMYYSHPAKIDIPVLPTLDSEDATLIDIPDTAAPQLVELIAADLLRNERPDMSGDFTEQAYIGLNQINDSRDVNEGSKQVIDVNNW